MLLVDKVPVSGDNPNVVKTLVATGLPEYSEVLFCRAAHSRIRDAMQVDDPIEPSSSGIFFLVCYEYSGGKGEYKAYFSCKKSAIFPMISVSVMPSRESSSPGVLTRVTEIPSCI